MPGDQFFETPPGGVSSLHWCVRCGTGWDCPLDPPRCWRCGRFIPRATAKIWFFGHSYPTALKRYGLTPKDLQRPPRTLF